jgi:hypothetical protein
MERHFLRLINQMMELKMGKMEVRFQLKLVE